MRRDNNGEGIREIRRWEAGHANRGELRHQYEYGGAGH